MIESLFAALGDVGSACLVLFLVALIGAGSSMFMAFGLGWVVWGKTHKETVEREAFFRGIAFDSLALADARSRDE